ncbi:hypothetical protein BB561_003690 [Smittium simulii]|uniref:Uncharacterized protein n=1 Tax=Smittium simulii TaxID=133385 RepID=A0A2T9YK19_9FUNG|nr:hypothetical protein BB561_003690 [Smittium simulii]
MTHNGHYRGMDDSSPPEHLVVNNQFLLLAIIDFLLDRFGTISVDGIGIGLNNNILIRSGYRAADFHYKVNRVTISFSL